MPPGRSEMERERKGTGGGEAQLVSIGRDCEGEYHSSSHSCKLMLLTTVLFWDACVIDHDVLSVNDYVFDNDCFFGTHVLSTTTLCLTTIFLFGNGFICWQ